MTDVTEQPNAPIATGAVGATDVQKETLHSRLDAYLEQAGAYVHEKVNALLDDLAHIFDAGEDDEAPATDGDPKAPATDGDPQVKAPATDGDAAQSETPAT